MIKVKVKKRVNEKKEDERDRRERIFPGISELDRLNKGILEEEPVEVSEEELYRLSKRLVKLKQLVVDYEAYIKRLKSKAVSIKNEPFDSKLHFCSKIKDSVSGKLSKDTK